MILIEDTHTGKELAGKPVISTLNLMAQGAVTTPAGTITPVERTHTPDQNTTPEKLPSAGPPFPLPAGVNKFGFTGQWLIDWDLYTEAAVPLQALVGNWGHQWHPSTEQGQFRKAQGKSAFEERQHILRLCGQDRIRVLILPHHKADDRAPLTVRRQANVWLIQGVDFDMQMGEHNHLFQSAEKKVLTTFGAEAAEGFGIKLAGGPVEIVITAMDATLTIGGGPGRRTVTLPEGWSVRTPNRGTASVRQSGTTVQIETTDNKPVTLEIKREPAVEKAATGPAVQPYLGMRIRKLLVGTDCHRQPT